MTLAPMCFAHDTAMLANRSLNDQVGLRVSSLSSKRHGTRPSAAISGVAPSPRLTASSIATGS